MRHLFVAMAMLVLFLALPIPVRAEPATPVANPQPILTPEPGLFASESALLAPGSISQFSRGRADQLSVVSIFPSNDPASFLVVLRNNTRSAINKVEISAKMKADSGVVALGVTTFTNPAVITPDGLAFTFVKLEGDLAAAGASSDPDVTVARADFTEDPTYDDLRIASAAVTEKQTIVSLINDTYSYPYHASVLALCFRGPNTGPVRLYSWAGDTVDFNGALTRGASETVTVDAPEGCTDRYIVVAAGF